MQLRAWVVFWSLIFAIVVGWGPLPILAQQGAQGGEWRYYAGDAAGTKYSPLDQINKNNVKELRVAWRWKSDNFGAGPDPYLQSTPLMVGGVLFATAGARRDVVAIDGVTGETLWMYRVDEGTRGALSPVRSKTGRGVAYWTDGKEERIIHVTLGYRLVALDAKTGRPVPTFGNSGMVDLYEGLPQAVPADGLIGWNSPAMIVGNVAVIGAAFSTGTVRTPLAGAIRGYDVITGKRLWIFNTIPRRGEFGSDTWEDGSLEYASNVGAWAPMAADLELGYVYVPTETPTIDTYGGHRPGSNLFADSLVCLDAKTGKRIWHYQLVHHGLWDWDIPAHPVLGDIVLNGRRIKTVAQVTKQAFTYVFDRVTGELVWPIEERPVPPSNVPTEKSSPTQPFPTKPPPFDRQGIGPDDVIDFTPELKAEGLRILSEYRIGPIFTPPSIVDPLGTKGTLQVPALSGAGNWQAAGFDPETGVLFVPSATNVSIAAVRECAPGQTNVPTLKYCFTTGGGDRALTVQGLPLIKPPWGRITAIDLNTGTHLWMVPNADTPDLVKNHPALKQMSLGKTGRQDRGALMVTKTLLFAGEGYGGFAVPQGSGGATFRAYDKGTGETVWEFKLPANQASAPMTYMAGGKQYIVVAVGAPNHAGEFISLSLP